MSSRRPHHQSGLYEHLTGDASDGAAAAVKLFISYRRSDSAHFAERLAERTSQHARHRSIFFDIDSIGAGEDFERRIRAAIDQRTVLVRADRAGAGSSRRLFDDRDFVRLEVRRALCCPQPGCPSAAGRHACRQPTESFLPISTCCRGWAIPVRHAAFDRDVLHLHRYGHGAQAGRRLHAIRAQPSRHRVHRRSDRRRGVAIAHFPLTLAADRRTPGKESTPLRRA